LILGQTTNNVINMNPLQFLIENIKEVKERGITYTMDGFTTLLENSMNEVNRVEVIEHGKGRIYTNYDVKDMEFSMQDDDKTLKIFIK